MLVGAHVSAAGGVASAPPRGTEIGCETIQIFCKNQRQWKAKELTDTEAEAFRDGKRDAGFSKTIVHDSYLINLGAPNPETWTKSRDAFRDEMQRCTALGITYLNFHPGAHVGDGEEACIERIVGTVGQLLDDEDPQDLRLLIENTAGQGTNIGYSLEHLADLLEGIGDDRVGVCFDTQHAYAAGLDIKSADGYDALWERFDDVVGLGHLHAFHLNDSKKPMGERVDRHERLGHGTIGWDAFERLVNDPRFAGIPGVLETPGGPEGWEEELARLKAARGSSAPDRDPPGVARPAASAN